MDIERLKYPIGKFQRPEIIDESMIAESVECIQNFPKQIETEVNALSDMQLDTPYRPEGWTIRQVVHHCADSHMNALIRLKLTLTEESPIIKPYIESLWAELADSKNMPIAPSLRIIENVHLRWVAVLNSMKKEDYSRFYIHPEYNHTYRLDEFIALYAWHCNHHLAHITSLKNKED